MINFSNLFAGNTLLVLVSVIAFLGAVIGIFYWLSKSRSQSYYYGYNQANEILKKIGQKLWLEINRDGGLRLEDKTRSFINKIIDLALDQKRFLTEKKMGELEAKLRELKEEKNKLLNWQNISGSDALAKELNYANEKIYHDIDSLKDTDKVEKFLTASTKQFEADYAAGLDKLNHDSYLLDEEIKKIEAKIDELKEINKQTVTAETEIKIEYLPYEKTRGLLDRSVASFKIGFLKIFFLLAVGVLFIMDFIVTYNAFVNSWSAEILQKQFIAFPLLNIKIDYQTASAFAGIFLPIFILIIFELLLDGFWKEEERKKLFNQLLFVLFICINIALFAYGFFLFIITRTQGNVSGLIDVMMASFIMPTVMVAAFALREIRKGDGFYFIFAPMEVIFYTLVLLFLFILNPILLVIGYAKPWIKKGAEVNKRNQIIKNYQNDIRKLNEQKAEKEADLAAEYLVYLGKIKTWENKNYSLGQLKNKIKQINQENLTKIEELNRAAIQRLNTYLGKINQQIKAISQEIEEEQHSKNQAILGAQDAATKNFQPDFDL
jgi:hypothetical protein